jgi:hypothetical protein
MVAGAGEYEGGNVNRGGVVVERQKFCSVVHWWEELFPPKYEVFSLPLA